MLFVGLSVLLLFCSLSCCLFGSHVSRPGPGGYTLSHLSLPARLARLNCLRLSPSRVVVVPVVGFPPVRFVSSRTLASLDDAIASLVQEASHVS